MHVPDGFLDQPTSLATGAIAAAGVVAALVRARREGVDERVAPMVGIAATVVFAVQMANFPVGAGVSGHLMGGVLLAVLVGPAVALLCMSVVLVVQAFVFADGGITALGTNVTLLGVVAIAVGWGVFRVALRALPNNRRSLVAASAIGAFVSVPAAAAVFMVLFAVGGQVPVPLDAAFATMIGWHVVIGVGEAVITALMVSAVLAARPDLVHAARPVLASAPRRVRAPGRVAEKVPV